jgi:hypothetical protein
MKATADILQADSKHEKQKPVPAIRAFTQAHPSKPITDPAKLLGQLMACEPKLGPGVQFCFGLIYKRPNPRNPAKKQWWEERTVTGSYEDAAADCVQKVMALKPPVRVHLECHRRYKPPVDGKDAPLAPREHRLNGIDQAFERAKARLAARKKEVSG